SPRRSHPHLLFTLHVSPFTFHPSRFTLHVFTFHPSRFTFHPHSTLPPFTFSTSPVMCRARSLHRNTIGPAISSGEAIRPRGIVRRTRSLPSPAKAGSHISVSTHPGARQLTAMSGAHSIASDLVREISAPL